MPDVSPLGHGSGALSFMPVRGSCVPCSGALSDSQGSPPHGSASSVVSAQSAAARAGSSRFHRRRAFRRVRGPEGIPAAEAVLRALTFSALGAPSGNRKGGKIGRFSAAGHAQNTLYFGPSVLSCVSVFDRKKRLKSYFKITFCPAGMPAAPLSLPLTIVYNVTVRVTSERYQE